MKKQSKQIKQTFLKLFGYLGCCQPSMLLERLCIARQNLVQANQTHPKTHPEYWQLKLGPGVIWKQPDMTLKGTTLCVCVTVQVYDKHVGLFT